MSIASSAFNVKSIESSNDMQDLKQQIKLLSEENTTLRENLQEVIELNNKLTNAIQEYNKLHIDNFGAVTQDQIEQMVLKVADLERQLENERNKKQQSNFEYRQNDNYASQNATDESLEQILKVIQQLTCNFQIMQDQYQTDIQNLQIQLQQQKEQNDNALKQVEEKFSIFNDLYKQLLEELKTKQQMISRLNHDLMIARNKKSQFTNKQMKISLTIEDLKNTLEKKIDQKQQVIKAYQKLLQNLKQKFNEPI